MSGNSALIKANFLDMIISSAIVAWTIGSTLIISLLIKQDRNLMAILATGLFLLVLLVLALRLLRGNNKRRKAEISRVDAWNRQVEVVQSDQLLENLPVALLRLCTNGRIEFGNMAARKLIGRGNLTGLFFADLVEGLGRSMRERLQDAIKGEVGRTSEMGRCVRNGEEIFLQVTLMQMSYVKGDCCMAVLSDKTELKMLEAQFVQSQKMEAVGLLAGGVAHDFNNLLTAINGHSDLLLLRHKSGDADYGDLIQIRQNSIRAAALVRQLLAFSRKQTLRPKIVNLVDTLNELTKLLNRLLGEKVTLIIEDSPDLQPVRVDVQQFEQVIMNLVVNARDAMPDGGTVTIQTKNLHLKQPLKRDRATIPVGKYVLVKVLDEGYGIDAKTLPKIFEPFFTTKRIGEGTGLGLSTVYGIIKQTGGFVFVQSSATDGTEFDIFLPAHLAEDIEVSVKDPVEKGTKEKAKGRILLVEDEESVRSFATRALELKGYSIKEAASGEDALAALEGADDGFDLFISDIIMPGLNGPGWVRKALAAGARAKVIFISGYAEDAFSDEKDEIPGAAFLAKPFTLSELNKKVAEVLTGP